MNASHKVMVGIVVVVCLVLAVAAGWMLGSSRVAAATALAAEEGRNRYGQEGLRVSGTAVVRAAPDVAIVRVGYESRARLARQAKLANDRVMRKVLAAIQHNGVARKDIQTVEYRLFPVWEKWPTPTTRTLFWHVLHMVEVRVHKVGTVADVIDDASAAGADKVDNVQFEVESLHKLRGEAREMAAKVAREKAEQLARLMGARVGKVVSINDAAPGYRYWYASPAVNVSAQVSQERPSLLEVAAESVISGGQVVVEAREEVVFALE